MRFQSFKKTSNRLLIGAFVLSIILVVSFLISSRVVFNRYVDVRALRKEAVVLQLPAAEATAHTLPQTKGFIS